MNRREAIRQVAIGSSALLLWPGCNTVDVPNYTKTPLDRRKWELLQQFAESILPVDHELYPTLEPRAIYILNIVNNCTPQEEVEKFNHGLEKFQLYLSEKFGRSLEKLSEADLNALFDDLEVSDATDSDLHHFYMTIRYLSKQHFTTSEKYMTEKLEYEFIPGDYVGCVTI